MNEKKTVILSKLYVGTPKQLKVLKLECRLEGLTPEEFHHAYIELISEGEIYICRTERYVAKVTGKVRKK